MQHELVIVSPPEVDPPVMVPLSEIGCSAEGCDNTASAGRCAGCKQVHYCSQECQAAHWNDLHQTECHIGLRLPWKRKTTTAAASSSSSGGVRGLFRRRQPAPTAAPAPPTASASRVVEYAPGRGRDALGREFIIQNRGGMKVTMADVTHPSWR